MKTVRTVGAALALTAPLAVLGMSTASAEAPASGSSTASQTATTAVTVPMSTAGRATGVGTRPVEAASGPPVQTDRLGTAPSTTVPLTAAGTLTVIGVAGIVIARRRADL
ncbi:hypothetical protein PZ938_07005 [Luteipulveratus sp. YIM 133132]|uniref:hypothetical protein n=1 Tax=Luteipulveratus flavus TaxID=3031728 RepID=UPI0023AFCC11|nr:hypothetical protein [Luteipulveratus sp. YIM 133132]MDE9365352.1 hypothetical protein [Luteipulveratus sp. YIM 133132]